MLSTVLCAFSSLYTHVLGLSMEEDLRQIFGDTACHPERSEGSGSTDGEILRFAQNDSQDTTQVMSP
jgi:hypothetical protein